MIFEVKSFMCQSLRLTIFLSFFICCILPFLSLYLDLSSYHSISLFLSFFLSFSSFFHSFLFFFSFLFSFFLSFLLLFVFFLSYYLSSNRSISFFLSFFLSFLFFSFLFFFVAFVFPSLSFCHSLFLSFYVFLSPRLSFFLSLYIYCYKLREISKRRENYHPSGAPKCNFWTSSVFPWDPVVHTFGEKADVHSTWPLSSKTEDEQEPRLRWKMEHYFH